MIAKFLGVAHTRRILIEEYNGMSKHETALTRRYWEEETDGLLIEEFPAVRNKRGCRPRYLDGLVILGGTKLIGNTKKDLDTNAKAENLVKDREVIIIQTKATPLSMPLLGQALISIHLMEFHFKPKSIRSVAICTGGDPELKRIAESLGIKVVIYPKENVKASNPMKSFYHLFWEEELGGTMIEGSPAISKVTDSGSRVVIPGGTNQIVDPLKADITGKDIVIIQGNSKEIVGMYLLGQAIFSQKLLESYKSKSIRSIALCRKSDACMERAANLYGIEIVVYSPSGKEQQTLSQEILKVADEITPASDEMEGFSIIRSLLGKKVDESRVTYHKTASHFGIYLDNDQKKWICRFHFGPKRKSIDLALPSVPYQLRNNIKIETVDSLLNYNDELLRILNSRLNQEKS